MCGNTKRDFTSWKIISEYKTVKLEDVSNANCEYHPWITQDNLTMVCTRDHFKNKIPEFLKSMLERSEKSLMSVKHDSRTEGNHSEWVKIPMQCSDSGVPMIFYCTVGSFTWLYLTAALVQLLSQALMQCQQHFQKYHKQRSSLTSPKFSSLLISCRVNAPGDELVKLHASQVTKIK